MSGPWQHRRKASEHKRIRAALLPLVVFGLTPCYRCRHPLLATDRIELDHADDGTYGGFSHASPCAICGQRCNPQAGGIKAALNQGKRLRSRSCVICGRQFTASRGTDGHDAATCGRQVCLTELRRLRKAGEPDPDPPPQTGRPW